MKTLTIKQPWLEAILFLGKNVENRTWKTDYRGPICLHASKEWSASGEEFLKMMIDEIPSLKQIGCSNLLATAWNRRGAICGTAILDDVRVIGEDVNSIVAWATDNIWIHGPIAWYLKSVTPVIPVLESGRRRLWDYQGRLLSLYSKHQIVSKGKYLLSER